MAETALDAELKDYSSARFRDVRVEQADPWTVCGFVNSKNSYGGYVGWQQFYFLPVPKAPNGGALMVASDEALTKVIGDSCADPKTVWMKTDFSTRLQPAK